MEIDDIDKAKNLFIYFKSKYNLENNYDEIDKILNYDNYLIKLYLNSLKTDIDTLNLYKYKFNEELKKIINDYNIEKEDVLEILKLKNKILYI